MPYSFHLRIGNWVERISIVSIAIALAAAPSLAQEAPKSGWAMDPKSSCKIWDEVLEKNEVVNWSGNCVSGMAEGKGSAQWLINGKAEERYDGEMLGGKMNGTGILVFPSGLRYEGEFRNNDFHGHGKLTYSNGDVYEGQFAKDDRSGQGTFTLSDGRRYVGAWSEDYPHGTGTLTLRDGSSVSGTWKQGCLNEGAKKFALVATPKQCGIY